MDISFYQDSDLESLTDLLHEMSAHYGGADASPREAVRSNLVAHMLGPHSDVRLVLARIENCVVGMAAISLLYPAPKERGQLFMKDLYVAANHRAGGVGRSLMKWIARFATEHNCSRFDWTTEAGNNQALDFYRALGASHVVEKVYFRLDGQALETFASDAWV